MHPAELSSHRSLFSSLLSFIYLFSFRLCSSGMCVTSGLTSLTGVLSRWLLEATEREGSSGNCRILPGCYLQSPDTAKERRQNVVSYIDDLQRYRDLLPNKSCFGVLEGNMWNLCTTRPPGKRRTTTSLISHSSGENFSFLASIISFLLFFFFFCLCNVSAFLRIQRRFCVRISMCCSLPLCTPQKQASEVLVIKPFLLPECTVHSCQPSASQHSELLTLSVLSTHLHLQPWGVLLCKTFFMLVIINHIPFIYGAKRTWGLNLIEEGFLPFLPGFSGFEKSKKEYRQYILALWRIKDRK